MNTITSLNLLDYVTYNATEEELASYGLDEPELSVTVNYTYTDKESDEDAPLSGTCVIHISRNPEELKAAQEAEEKEETAEDVSKYVRIGDSQIVYTLDSVDYGILSAASYDDLRHREVFWADFADVYRIAISLEGTEHTLVSERNEEEDRVWYYQDEDAEIAATEETAETAAKETDGTEAAEDTEEDTLDLSDFGIALKALSASSFTGEKPTEKEEIRLILYLENENFPEVEIILYRYDGTSCLAVVDGESVSLVPRSSVMELVETVQAFVLR